MLHKLDKAFVTINRGVLGLMMFLMFIFVFTNVITRYVFGFSLNWAEELARFLMISICFIGAGLALREGRHVAIEIILNIIPSEKIRIGIKVFNAIIILAFMLLLVYLGFAYADSQMAQRSAVMRWSMGYIYWIIPIGSLIFITHLIAILKDFISTTMIEEQIQTEMENTDRREQL